MALPDAHLSLLEATRRFAGETVRPRVASWERERRIDSDALSEAAGIGLMGIEVPAQHGGLGLGFLAKNDVTRILAEADFGIAMSVVNSQNVAAKLCRYAPAEVCGNYLSDLLSAKRLGCTALTEPSAGSDFAAIQTTAKRCEGGWELNGEKAWIVNAVAADVVFVYAQTEPGSGAAGIGAFLVDGQREGFSRKDRFDLIGQHTIGTAGFELNGYIASDAELIIEPGKGFKSALRDINGARTYVAAMCLGMLDAAIAIVKEYGQSRQTFGRPLNRHQGWRWQVAEAVIDRRAAGLMVEEAAHEVESGEDAQISAAAAKVFATRAAEKHLPRLLQAMGAEGLREEHPLGRHIVGARVAQFVDGSTEMLLERVASVLR